MRWRIYIWRRTTWRPPRADARQALADIREVAARRAICYVAATRHLLGEILLRRGQLAAAEAELRAALDIDIGSAGLGNWRAARTEASLGWLLIEEGQGSAEGEPMLVAARSTLLKTVGPRHPETEQATARLADYYRAHHRDADAARVLAAN